MADHTRLKETLDLPGLERLLARVRGRLERGLGVEGRINLSNPSNAERDALRKLLGRTESRGASISVDLGELDRILKDSGMCEGIGEAVVTITGSLSSAKKNRALHAERWKLSIDEMTALCQQLPALAECIKTLLASGVLRRLSRSDPDRAVALVKEACAVAEMLPANDVPLAELAAKAVGDSHALDIGRPLCTIVLRLAALIGGIALSEGAESRREVLASVGVLCDEVSAPILVLNLRAEGSTVTGRALNLHAEAGEPYWLTNRQLLRHPPDFRLETVGPLVYICENPTVVAAVANALGARSKPLVCIDGQPKTSSRLLFERLTAAGIELAYHGDFDWPGIQIGNLMMRRHGVRPWRYSATDYRQCSQGTKLDGKPVQAVWDAQLGLEMRRISRAVHEEQVLDLLLGDMVL